MNARYKYAQSNRALRIPRAIIQAVNERRKHTIRFDETSEVTIGTTIHQQPIFFARSIWLDKTVIKAHGPTRPISKSTKAQQDSKSEPPVRNHITTGVNTNINTSVIHHTQENTKKISESLWEGRIRKGGSIIVQRQITNRVVQSSNEAPKKKSPKRFPT
jgi:hypothetical protein